MFILLLFAFLAGIVTILSPCILPVLPIVLSGSLTGGKKRPLGIVTGFIISFTFFTLFLTTIVRATGLPADSLRFIAVIVIGFFGASLLIPQLQLILEKIFSRVAGLAPQQSQKEGYVDGILVGLSLGLIWTPCVGPILASVISLALTGTVTTTAFFITLAYATGTAIPMLAITYGGRNLLTKTPWLLSHTRTIQKIFGVLMIATALAIYLNLDRKFQTYILEKFPSYGSGLIKLEENSLVKNALLALQGKPVDESTKGKPMFDLLTSPAPDFIGGQTWFNLPAGRQVLNLQELKGKVVLVDFWTYTCINCIRTLPYLKTWYQKYANKGLVIVGVHTPEFEFEKKADNVARAIKDFGITYPVVQDNDYAIWNAYDNHYWPAHYLIDKDGRIRDTHFGEGAYDETEKKIVELLNETGTNIDESAINNPTYQVYSHTPETYLGSARSAYMPAYTLTGTWTKSSEYAMPATGATLTFPFDAKEVFLVMRPKVANKPGDIQVLLDGLVVGQEVSGDDVVQGVITVDTDRLYKIIKLPSPGKHILQLKFLDSNLELYAFTFG